MLEVSVASQVPFESTEPSQVSEPVQGVAPGAQKEPAVAPFVRQVPATGSGTPAALTLSTQVRPIAHWIVMTLQGMPAALAVFTQRPSTGSAVSLHIAGLVHAVPVVLQPPPRAPVAVQTPR